MKLVDKYKSEYELDKADFQYLERIKLKKDRLYDNWGVVYFTTADDNYQYQPLGCFNNDNGAKMIFYDKYGKNVNIKGFATI